MSTLERAIAVAAGAHVGQVDKGGQPYILHPLRVMMNVEGEHAKMAAVLHDVLEDTKVNVADLVNHQFPDEVIKAVVALTKLPGMSRADAAKQAARDPIALEVKLADVYDNMQMSRIPNPSVRDWKRYMEYQQVYLDLWQAKEKMYGPQ
jgi:(p)ppGpp synthase/HD superfamily hydrolase